MKYLKSFKESIIAPTEKANEFLDEVYQELHKRPSQYAPPRNMTIDQLQEIGNKYDIELVNYNKFYSELPVEDKKTAPKRDPRALIFGLFNPVTHKIRIVFNVPSINIHLFDWLKQVVEHESIHSGQQSKRTWSPERLPNPTDQEKYFSVKDEIMAFSQSIANELADRHRNLRDATKHLDDSPNYCAVKNVVSTEVLNKYKKYIYLYLQRLFA